MKKTLSILLSALLLAGMTTVAAADETQASDAYNYYGEITYTGVQAPAVADNSIVGEIIGGAATVEGREFDKAFDGALNTWWEGTGAIFEMWFGVKTAEPAVATSFTLATQDNEGDGVADRRHAMWGGRLQGSNDGITWNDLYVYEYVDFEDYANDEESSYITIAFENETAYTFFRYVNNDDGCHAVSELQIFGAAAEAPKASDIYNYYGEITYTGIQAATIADNSIVGEVIGNATQAEGFEFDKAFDGTISTFWNGSGAIFDMWVGIKTAEPVVATSFTIATQDNDGDGVSDRRHAMWGSRLQGSNDGITWNDLYIYEYVDFEDYANDEESTWLTIAFENETAYTFFRYLNNDDGANAVAEVQIFGAAAEAPKASDAYNYYGTITYTGVQAPAVADNSIVGEIIGGAATVEGREFDKAFDGALNTWWEGTGAIFEMWFGIKTAEPVVAKSFTLATQDNEGDGVADRRHAMWGGRLQGSNDGITWNDLYVYEYVDFEDYANDEESNYITIAFENETAYTFFRYVNNDVATLFPNSIFSVTLLLRTNLGSLTFDAGVIAAVAAVVSAAGYAIARKRK